jgi:hypothetical protein
MPIDPSIAMGVRPVQTPNMLANYAQVQELGVNQLKMQEAQQSIADRNALRGLDMSAPDYISQVGRVNPKLAMELQKSQLEGKKGQVELEANLMKNARNTLAPINDQGTYDLWRQQTISQLPTVAQFLPAKFDKDVKTALMLEADKYIKQTQFSAVEQADLKIKQGQLGVSQGQLNLSREGQRLQYDPTVQANIAESKKIGEARAEGVIAPLKDARANLKALKTAGYDPITGADRVSDLIKASTSGAVETGLAASYGAMPGASATSGQEAIGKLASISKTLTLDLLDGKLGAGISNDDRTALEQRFGDMANSMIPSDKRLAAWGEAKEIMRRAAMLPEPGQVAPAAAPSDNKNNNNAPRKPLKDIFK